MSDGQGHWNKFYASKSSDLLSWTEGTRQPSLEWILESSPEREARIIDVGGGTSLLVDRLLDAGYNRPAVMDISSTALARAQGRLGTRSQQVEWIEANVVEFHSAHRFSFWHDRAVFHFLTEEQDRQKYKEALCSTLLPQGKALIATFSTSGPFKCSGLEVTRYDEKSLVGELGPSFDVIRIERITHKTPWGSNQEFVYGLFSLK